MTEIDDNVFPVEWHEFRAEWRRFLARHPEMKRAGHLRRKFPRDPNLMADEVMGVFRVGRHTVELSEVTMPVFGERPRRTARYVGLTFATKDGRETDLASSWCDLEDILGIAPTGRVVTITSERVSTEDDGEGGSDELVLHADSEVHPWGEEDVEYDEEDDRFGPHRACAWAYDLIDRNGGVHPSSSLAPFADSYTSDWHQHTDGTQSCITIRLDGFAPHEHAAIYEAVTGRSALNAR